MSHPSVQGQNGHGRHFLYLRNCASSLTVTSQLDAGMHPAYDGLAALPFYDDFDLSTVDVLLISQ